MRLVRFSLLVYCLVGSSATAIAKDRKFTLYITSAEIRDAHGFVDPLARKPLEDSAKDIRQDNMRLRDFRPAKFAHDADLLLTIVGRGVDDEIWGSTTVSLPLQGGAQFSAAQPSVLHHFWVEAQLSIRGLEAHTFRADTSHQLRSSSGAWTNCADSLAKQITVWTKANVAQIESWLTRP